MNGVKYYRLMKRLSREKLAALSGVSIPTLGKMENVRQPGRIYSSNYKKTAKVLCISVDDLIKNDYPDPKNGPKRSAYPSRTENLNNCISVYRRRHLLTYEKLAFRLGLKTRERARQICADNVPNKKHILILAKYENISAEEFIRKYSNQEVINI